MKKGTGRAMKPGSAHFMQMKLGCMCEAVEKYTSVALTEPSQKSYNATEGGIASFLNILNGLPGIEVGGELYMFSTHFFLKRDCREMFLTLPTDDIKLAWLKQAYEREVLKKKKIVFLCYVSIILIKSLLVVIQERLELV